MKEKKPELNSTMDPMPEEKKIRCSWCSKELGDISCAAKYIPGTFCSGYCADIADFNRMLNELTLPSY